MRRVLTAVWSFILLPLSIEEANAQSPISVFQNVRNASIYLKVTFRDPNNPDNTCTTLSEGTGFIVSEGGGVITAAHIFDIPDACSGFTDYRVVGRIGYLVNPEIPLAIVDIDPDGDVAVLRLGSRADPYASLDLCFVESLAFGHPVYAFGFALGEDLTGLDATYQGIGGTGRWRMSSLFTYGMSGGPITTVTGKVVALVKGGVRGAPAVQTATPLYWASTQLFTAGVFDPQPCNEEDVASLGHNGGIEPVTFPKFESNLDMYLLDVALAATAPTTRRVAQSVVHEFSNAASCAETWSTRTFQACLSDGARITDVKGPFVITASNDGKSWYERIEDRPSCVNLFYGYSDRGLDGSGNCLGDGWIRAEYDLEGVVNGEDESRRARQTREVTAPTGSPMSQLFEAPPDLLDGLDHGQVKWSYEAIVKRTRDDAFLSQLSKANPSSGPFTSQQESNGSVVVTIQP